MDTVSVGWLFNTFGVPGVFLFLLWRGMVFFAPIIKDEAVPMCKQIGVKHIEFLDNTSAMLGKVTSTQEQHSATLAEHGKKLNEIHSKIKE